jgi:hypothetical protein
MTILLFNYQEEWTSIKIKLLNFPYLPKEKEKENT